jgi:eukaryotic-like serine/threonine-protein kinase
MSEPKNPNPLEAACPVCEKAPEFCSCGPAADGSAAPTGQWIKDLVSGAPKSETINPATSQAHIGTIINDRYELLDLLGQGGMGSVFKAKHLLLERVFALKVLKIGTADSQDSRARFEREAKTAARLSHPSLVSVYDYGTTGAGEPFIVMDFIPGKSLAEIVSTTGPLETKRAIRIFSQIVDGLAHAHANGVIHRDLKPSNVMILASDQGQDSVKIVDFGIAKVVGDQGDTTPQLTKTGEVFGSPMYMSPEQCRGQPPDHRSDIYSLGCLMYESLLGQPVFSADNSLALIFKHINESPPGFSSSTKQVVVPDSLANVVLKALAKAPDDRYQSMDEVRKALNEVTEGSSPAVVPSPPASSISKMWAALAAVVALIVTAVVGMAFYSNNLLTPSPPTTQPTTPPAPSPITSPTTTAPVEDVKRPRTETPVPASPLPAVAEPSNSEKLRTSDKHGKSAHTTSTATKRKLNHNGLSRLESKFKSILRKL